MLKATVPPDVPTPAPAPISPVGCSSNETLVDLYLKKKSNIWTLQRLFLRLWMIEIIGNML